MPSPRPKCWSQCAWIPVWYVWELVHDSACFRPLCSIMYQCHTVRSFESEVKISSDKRISKLHTYVPIAIKNFLPWGIDPFTGMVDMWADRKAGSHEIFATFHDFTWQGLPWSLWFGGKRTCGSWKAQLWVFFGELGAVAFRLSWFRSPLLGSFRGAYFSISEHVVEQSWKMDERSTVDLCPRSIPNILL